MSSLPSVSDPSIPSIVDHDVPCRSCGYNLRMQAVGGICPECATPVQMSMGAILLRNADPRFLQKLSLGLRLVYWSTWLLIVVVIWIGAIFRGLNHLAALILVGVSGLACLGTWLVTTPDPSGLGEKEYGGLRIFARVLGLAILVGSLSFGAGTTVTPMVYFFIRSGATLTQFLWGVCLYFFLRRLSKRTLMQRPGGIDAMFVFFCIVYFAWLVPNFMVTLGGHRRSHVDLQSCLSLAFVNVMLAPLIKVLKPEFTAAKLTSSWRIAGSFLYSAKQLFRRKNGNSQ